MNLGSGLRDGVYPGDRAPRLGLLLHAEGEDARADGPHRDLHQPGVRRAAAPPLRRRTAPFPLVPHRDARIHGRRAPRRRQRSDDHRLQPPVRHDVGAARKTSSATETTAPPSPTSSPASRHPECVRRARHGAVQKTRTRPVSMSWNSGTGGSSSGTPSPSGSTGTPVGRVWSFRDVTERKHVEVGPPQRARQRHRQVVEGLPEVIFETDSAGLWTLLNPAWTDITGILGRRVPRRFVSGFRAP
jgi:PAS domain-containing protein